MMVPKNPQKTKKNKKKPQNNHKNTKHNGNNGHHSLPPGRQSDHPTFVSLSMKAARGDCTTGGRVGNWYDEFTQYCIIPLGHKTSVSFAGFFPHLQSAARRWDRPRVATWSRTPSPSPGSANSAALHMSLCSNPPCPSCQIESDFLSATG